MSEPRSMRPSRPPPSQKPADRTLAAEVPTKLVETSPNPTGTVEKAAVSAAADSVDERGELSSAHAAMPRSGVTKAARRYHARMLLRLIALLRVSGPRVPRTVRGVGAGRWQRLTQQEHANLRVPLCAGRSRRCAGLHRATSQVRFATPSRVVRCVEPARRAARGTARSEPRSRETIG